MEREYSNLNSIEKTAGLQIYVKFNMFGMYKRKGRKMMLTFFYQIVALQPLREEAQEMTSTGLTKY